jgi:hypothetical protein
MHETANSRRGSNSLRQLGRGAEMRR